MERNYTPQELVTLTGVNLDTLRYYERIGLIDRVPRASSGHRRYRDADVTRLNFLKKLKATGMSLNHMVHYVALFRMGESTLVERRLMLEAHREKVLAHMQIMNDTLDLLDTKIANYHQQEAHLKETV